MKMNWLEFVNGTTPLDLWESKCQAGERIYPGLSFDTTLPQGWLDGMSDEAKTHRVYACTKGPLSRDETYEIIRSGTVWGYPKGNNIGGPYPLTTEAASLLLSLLAIVAVEGCGFTQEDMVEMIEHHKERWLNAAHAPLIVPTV